MNTKSVLFLLLSFYLVNCQQHSYTSILHPITPLPKGIKESSGLAWYRGKYVWTVEDSGNEDEIYKIDFEGNLIKTFEVKNATNIDWEDLASDANGNLYVGDFGNNKNKRRDLVIYKLPNPEWEKGDKIEAEKIKFHYPQQKKFPPKKSKLFFDAEGFFHHNDYLYLFTRNRATPFDGRSFVYKIPDRKGTYKAQKIGEIVLCEDSKSYCAVTSATISDDGKYLVLLTYGSLWVSKDFDLDDLTTAKWTRIPFGVTTQTESVTFMDGKTVLISNEKSLQNKSYLYSLDLDSILKAKAQPERKP